MENLLLLTILIQEHGNKMNTYAILTKQCLEPVIREASSCSIQELIRNPQPVNGQRVRDFEALSPK